MLKALNNSLYFKQCANQMWHFNKVPSYGSMLMKQQVYAPMFYQQYNYLNPLLRPSILACQPCMTFSAQSRILFGTDSPAYSNRYHRGLFHGKTHGQRKKRVFSMKYRIETQKPNIFRKTVKSDILDKEFKLWLSTKARKCIMKAGSLDNYLLTTEPSKIHSNFGLYLRELIKQK